MIEFRDPKNLSPREIALNDQVFAVAERDADIFLEAMRRHHQSEPGCTEPYCFPAALASGFEKADKQKIIILCLVLAKRLLAQDKDT